MNLKSDVIKRSNGIYAKLYSFLRFIILPIEKIDDIIPKIGKIVDYGCGFGTTSCYFALSSKNRNVVGIEQNAERVKKAIKTTKGIANLKFKFGDISKIKIASADAHLLIDVLHHIPYKEQVTLLEKIIKEMAKGNLLIIKEIDKKSLLKYFWNYIHDKIMTFNDKLYFKDQKWFEDFFSRNGLNSKVIRCENILYPHFIIVARK